MVGDSQIGKTSLMVKYVEGSFEYVVTDCDCADYAAKTISKR